MGRLLGYAFVVALLGLTCARAMAAPGSEDAHAAAAASESSTVVPGAGETLPQQVDALRLEMGELRSGMQDLAKGQQPPGWAAEMQAQLDRRMERMAEMQERLAARIETPAPRLDEPIVLFTVAGCTMLLGFVIGRGVQRRTNRRDLRLRL